MTQILYQGVSILLVEDSPSDAKLTMKQLKASKIVNEIFWVDNGERALSFLHQQDPYENEDRPDLILLDLNLPGLDGRELLAEVKSDPHLKRIPVIILTTSSNEIDIIESYNLGANCYITKPVDLQQFINVINWVKDFWLVVVKLPPER